jgi:hypothetical protein
MVSSCKGDFITALPGSCRLFPRANLVNSLSALQHFSISGLFAELLIGRLAESH